MDTVIARCPIPNASAEQFAGAVAYAGEVACNLLWAGGNALTLRLGSYLRSQQPGTGALVESFVAKAVNPTSHDILLEAICDRDPAAGHRDVNPFSLNLWPLTIGLRPTTIAEALGANLMALPPYSGSLNHLAMTIYSDQAMFELRKAISSIFAMAVVRGSDDMGIMLQRGVESKAVVPVTKFRKVKKMVERQKRDAKGAVIFTEATGPDGKPIYDTVLNPRTKQPLFDQQSGEIRKRRRLNYEMEKVEVEVEEAYSEMVEVVHTALYLLVAKNNVIRQDDFLAISVHEGAYDPTWMLTDVLSGACAGKQPFHGMGDAEG